MSLTTVYERFLASPNPLSLSENAALHYVPTLTSFAESGPVIRHLESQSKDVVKLKSFKTINAVQGPSSVALEVDTTLEFLSGGGAYLPGLENLVSGRAVTLPVTHIVHFDADQKITQMRISWDQGSLLKQTEVIGSRGRNWPVSDGKNQISLIASSASHQPTTPQPTAPTSPRGRSAGENSHVDRNGSPSKRLVKDPYTSMDTYFVQQTIENLSMSQAVPAAAPPPPRAESFKPAPRDITEILAAGLEGKEPDSPTKASVVAPKGGSNQKFVRNRILEENEEDFASPKIYKTNPARYNHFDLGEVSEDDPFQYNKSVSKSQDTQTRPVNGNASKHTSQWDLSDFNTPQKIALKERPDGKVHFTLDGDSRAPTDSPNKAAASKPRRDAAANFELKDDGTPVERKAVPKPRKDSQAHFALDNRPTPVATRIIARTDAAKDLYRDPLDQASDDHPLADISNNAARRKDFGSSWDMNDDDLGRSKTNNENNGAASHHHNKSWQHANASWDAYDQPAGQERRPTSKDFKKVLEPQWGLGEEEKQRQSTATSAATAGGANKGFWNF
ncbi:hypothetical protein DV736_g2687, partial [Chaetothyriales sp. CBS 134916]